jgi:hypothetical protein
MKGRRFPIILDVLVVGGASKIVGMKSGNVSETSFCVLGYACFFNAGLDLGYGSKTAETEY